MFLSPNGKWTNPLVIAASFYPPSSPSCVFSSPLLATWHLDKALGISIGLALSQLPVPWPLHPLAKASRRLRNAAKGEQEEGWFGAECMAGASTAGLAVGRVWKVAPSPPSALEAASGPHLWLYLGPGFCFLGLWVPWGKSRVGGKNPAAEGDRHVDACA